MKTRTMEHGNLPATTAPRDQSGITDFSAGAGKVTFGNMPQISFAGTSAWTIELWVYLDALVDQMHLVSRAGEFELMTQGARIHAARTNQIVPLVSDAFLETHTWYNLAVTFDGFTMALYVNGRRRTLVTLTDAGVANQGQPMTLGGSFYGQVASARFWSIAVAPGLLYERQWSDYAAGTAGLVAQLDFKVSPPADTSGNRTPVSISPAGVHYLHLTPAAHLELDAFCDPYNDVNVNPGGTAADFTVMAWVSPTALSAGGVTIFSNGTLGEAGMTLALDAAGKVVFRIGAAAAVTSSSALQLNRWTNVACTWSASTGAAAIYVDGTQDATGTIAFSASSPSGTPLIGANVTSGAALPAANFFGYIQSVSVWSYVLPAAAIVQYMTDDPINDPNCIADYDLVLPRAQNSASLNPIGIVGTNALTVITSPATGPAAVPRRTRGGGAPIAGTRPDRVTAEHFDAAARERFVEEFRAFMSDELGLAAEQQEELASRMHENLSRVEQQLREGTLKIAHATRLERNDDGTGRIFLTVDGEEVLVFEGALDPCTMWAISFIIAIGIALYTVFGFALNLRNVGVLTNYLGQRINNIGLLPQLRAVFSRGVSPTAVFKGLRLLWDFGLLIGMMKFFWQMVTKSVSKWTVLSLGARLVLLFSPFAPLEIAIFVTELGLALVGVYNVWNDPNNCWRSTQALQAPQAA